MDPIGLVTVRDLAHLLATRSGQDRTYRLSRILDAEELTEPAQRPDHVDLDQAWRERGTRFRTGGDQVTAHVRVHPARRDDPAGTALTVRAEHTDDDGWHRVEATVQDTRHAEWALWSLGARAEALAPPWLGAALRDRAAAVTALYEDPPDGE